MATKITDRRQENPKRIELCCAVQEGALCCYSLYLFLDLQIGSLRWMSYIVATNGFIVDRRCLSVATDGDGCLRSEWVLKDFTEDNAVCQGCIFCCELH